MKITIKDVILVGGGAIAGVFYVSYKLAQGCADGTFYFQNRRSDGTLEDCGKILFDPSAKTEEETSE